jgi:hypothetical protein
MLTRLGFSVTFAALLSGIPVGLGQETVARPAPSTDPAVFTEFYEQLPNRNIEPSFEEMARINTSLREVNNEAFIIIRFREELMKKAFYPYAAEPCPQVVVFIEVYGIDNDSTDPLTLRPLGDQSTEGTVTEFPQASRGEQPTTRPNAIPRAANQRRRDHTTCDVIATTGTGGAENLLNELNAEVQQSAVERPLVERLINIAQAQETVINRLTNELTALTPGVEYVFNPAQVRNSVIPDQRIDLAVLNAADYDRIKIRVTNIVTQEVHEVDVLPAPLGFRANVAPSLMFLNRIGVDDTTAQEANITDVNFSASPGVSISGTLLVRRDGGFLTEFLRFVRPGIGLNASYLGWNDDNDAGTLEIGLGVQASLFNNIIYGTYGWNLQAPEYNAYFGIGLNFVNLVDLFN